MSLGVIRIHYGVKLQMIYQRSGKMMDRGHRVSEISFTYSTNCHMLGITGTAEFQATADKYVTITVLARILHLWYPYNILQLYSK